MIRLLSLGPSWGSVWQFASSSLCHGIRRTLPNTAPRQANGNETLVLYSASAALQLLYQLSEASSGRAHAVNMAVAQCRKSGYF